jgi:hypothetical protein
LFRQVQNPRHVLSELLQNADDAGATEAEASLGNGQFVFCHNGEDFTEEQFTSLCRFGYSNKRALHTIGFRGIGFKSTFSLGDEVRLATPSLSVAFRSRRFTEPAWVERQDTHGAWTVVRVAVQDESRQQELQKNLDDWLTTPISLLFFRSIRSLRIGERAVEWVPAGAGPVASSEWMALSSHPDTRYLVVRSNEENFPPESAVEIREERMVKQDEEQPLPPCRVVLVLGAEGRLFVILPTGVKTALPFACNAPFVQDPARVAIKAPSTSPTNRWLLRRAGELAAQAMLGWLRRDDLAPELRCQAYDLMPEEVADEDSLGATCAHAATEAFMGLVRSEPILLSEGQVLKHEQGCYALPTVVLGIWRPEDVEGIFCGNDVSVLCRHVSAADRRKLMSWDLTVDFDRDCVLDPLSQANQRMVEAIPRPPSLQQLLTLWQYVGQDLTPGYACPEMLKTLRIVPIEASNTLCAAPDAVRFDAHGRLARPEDWSLLARFLAIVDGEWVGFLREQQLQAESQKDPALRKKVGLACALLDALGLGRDTDASTIIQRAAAGFFALPTTPMADCVRLAHIAARLNAALPPGFRYATRDMNRRPVTEAIVVDQEGGLEDLLPKCWYEQHVLHDAYWSGFTSCTREQWEQWVASERSGLLGFVPIALSSGGVMDESKVRSFCRGRGWELPLTYRSQYKRPYYCANDWDFDHSHWQYWEVRATADNQFWGRLVSELLQQPVRHWQGKAEASLQECARNGHSRPVELSSPFSKRSLQAAWIAKFRELPCLRDTRGGYHRPAELLRRTEKTRPLLDIEAFAAEECDTEALRPLLDLLGVRTDPPGPDGIIIRLKALAGAAVPPLHELEKLYRRLDQMLDDSASWSGRVRDAFSSEKLIWSECGTWTRASEVFLAADEDDVSGALVIPESVRDLALWTKVGVAERPTAELAIQWLKSLSSGNRLEEDEHRRVLLLLARYPERVWTECGHWLNLVGEWVPVRDLDLSLTRHGAVEWKHLFPQVRQRTADLQELTPDVCERPPFSHLTPLSGVIEERTQGLPASPPEPRRREWMQALGRTLRRTVLDDAEEMARVRSLASRLEWTCWQVAWGLAVVPHIDGVPAGMPRPVEVLWSGAVLYVPDQPASKLIRPVVHELSQPFHCEDIKEAMAYCVNRSAEEIVEYLEASLALAPAEPGFVPPEATNSGGAGTDTPIVTGSDGAEPEPVTGPQESAGLGAGGGADDGTAVVQVSGPDAPGGPDQPGGGPTLDTATETDGQPPRPPPRAHPPDLMARYAATRGYRPVAPGLLRHADGSSLARTQDGVFPWERRSSNGDVLQYYWPKEVCLQTEPLDLDAVKWELLDKRPDLYTLILLDSEDNPTEFPGRRLREHRDRGLVEVVSAAYRIVLKPAQRPA